MLKNTTKAILGIILSALLVTFLTIPAFASDLDTLLKKTEGLEEFLKQLTADMQSLSLEYDHIQEEIDNTESKITSNEALLGEAQEACDSQYDRMKKRIVYLYESGDTNYLAAILSSDNLGDMLNRFEYINNIVGYDRNMLDKYVELVGVVDGLQTDLIARKAELEDLRTQAMENMYKAASVSETSTVDITEFGIDETAAHDIIQEYISENGDDIRAQLENIIRVAEAENPDYDPWAGMESIRDVLLNDVDPNAYDWSSVPAETTPVTPAQPAEPVQQVVEAPQQEIPTPAIETPVVDTPVIETPAIETPTAETPAAQTPVNTGTTSNRTINSSITQDDAYLIAALVSGEVGYTSYENQLAMAQVVINRINSDIFPDTAYDVLHQSGQFNYWDAEGNEIRSDTYFVENGPMDSAMQATNEILTNGTSEDFPYMGAVTEAFYYDNPEYFTDTYGEILDGNYYFNANWW